MLLDKKKVGFITKIGAVFLAVIFAATYVPLMFGSEETAKQPSQQEQMKQMIDSLKLAAESNPKDANAWLQLADVYYSQNRLNEALDSYKKAADITPKDIKPHFGMSVAAYGLGQIETATAEINEILRIDPKHAQSYYNLALCMTAKGDVEEAIANFEKYIELDPKGMQVEQAKEQIAKLKNPNANKDSAFDDVGSAGTGNTGKESEEPESPEDQLLESLKTKSLMGLDDPSENNNADDGGSFISIEPKEKDPTNPHQ